MIPRYSRPKMANVWSEENKFKTWLEIELCVCEALAEMGKIPADDLKNIREKAAFNIDRIDEIEKDVKHDVIAFLTNVGENVGDSARFVHQGLTSSDVLDTSFSLRLVKSIDILLEDFDQLLAASKKQALVHQSTLCIGRSHGIHAEPTTFGLKMLGFYAEFQRNKERLIAARKEVAVCAISGSVGTFATIDPFVEGEVAKRLGLERESVSTQVIPRDRYAVLFAIVGVIAGSIERLAVEIRHLQRTEVREAEEFFSVGQKGSSAMPHKRNPVLSENLTGLARMMRSYAIPAMENIALWHERDISHSSAERMMAPEAMTLLDFCLNRLVGIVDKLLIYPDTMKRNLDRLNGLVFSQRVLLALVDAGLSREKAYKAVQENAMRVWETGESFQYLLKKDKTVTAVLTKEKLESLFDYSFYTKNIGQIYDRVL